MLHTSFQLHTIKKLCKFHYIIYTSNSIHKTHKSTKNVRFKIRRKEGVFFNTKRKSGGVLKRHIMDDLRIGIRANKSGTRRHTVMAPIIITYLVIGHDKNQHTTRMTEVLQIFIDHPSGEKNYRRQIGDISCAIFFALSIKRGRALRYYRQIKANLCDEIVALFSQSVLCKGGVFFFRGE